MKPTVLCALVFATILLKTGVFGQDNTTMEAMRECREGWTYFPDTEACYLVSEKEYTWQEAVDYCDSQGSQLVSIHSPEENQFIASFRIEGKALWTGLREIARDEDNAIAFGWSDGSAVNYYNWGPDEPRYENADICVYVLMARHRGRGSWYNRRCDLTNKAVCKTGGNEVDCELTNWSCWTDCSRTCGSGTQSRIREVMQEPSAGGRPCGELTEYQFCEQQDCPVVCVMSPWTPWSDCSEDCGGGTQTRTRYVEVEPSNGGEPCPPEVEEEQICNKERCPGCPAPTKVIACEDDVATLGCPFGTVVYVTYANYGRLKDLEQCPNAGIPNTDCGVLESREIVRQICHGRESCEVAASNDIFGNPCVDTEKYLEVDYLCMDFGDAFPIYYW